MHSSERWTMYMVMAQSEPGQPTADAPMNACMFPLLTETTNKIKLFL